MGKAIMLVKYMRDRKSNLDGLVSYLHVSSCLWFGAQNGRAPSILSVHRRLWILRPRDDVSGPGRGRTSLFLPPGAGNPSYATGPVIKYCM